VEIALADGDASVAIRDLRQGCQGWQAAGAPYEAARARLLLAAALEAIGDPGSARMELEAAHVAFDRLGAAPDAGRTAGRLAAIG
jgi:hypothetical protein